MESINACPRCKGEAKTKKQELEFAGIRHSVVCKKCGLRLTGDFRTRKQAVVSWNGLSDCGILK